MKHIRNFFVKIGHFFKNFGQAVGQGDLFVKLSMVIMGAGFFRRHQIIKGILLTLLEGVIIAYACLVGFPYLSKFGTLGTVQFKSEYDKVLKKNVINNYDHSFEILLFSIVSIIIFVAFIIIYLNNVINARKLQIMAEDGKHINSFREDIKMYRNEKFHVTLLTLPCLGIICMTLVPLFVLILVAFTNYDQQHLPPSSLFTWIGISNFKRMFSDSLTDTFGYSFRKVLGWTLVWATFATFTTYIGGIIMAMFINNPKTKFPKMWRTFLIIAIAVPQFVSLLLVRNFFADTGIVNTICNNIGLTGLLKNIGWVKSSLTYIPFLTDPNWTKIMIILINIWIGIPYLMLIATGVLMNIPSDLTEAARIDGANGFQIFRKITMPYMLFVTGPYLVTSFVANINNFNVIYLLTQDVFVTLDQKLANSSAKEIDLLVTWLYRLTQEKYNYKMASVIGILVFVICSVFTLFAFSRMIKGDREEEFQ